MLRNACFIIASALALTQPAFAYDPRITPKDIVDAGGYCVGERCFLNGHAYHCVKGKCVTDNSR